MPWWTHGYRIFPVRDQTTVSNQQQYAKVHARTIEALNFHKCYQSVNKSNIEGNALYIFEQWYVANKNTNIKKANNYICLQKHKHKITTTYMSIEIHVLSSDRHTQLIGIKHLKGTQRSTYFIIGQAMTMQIIHKRNLQFFASTGKNHSITKVNCNMYMDSTIVGSLELRSKLTNIISLLKNITFRTNCLSW